MKVVVTGVAHEIARQLPINLAGSVRVHHANVTARGVVGE